MPWGSGNPATDEMYTGNQRRVHEGRAMVVVRAGDKAGEAILTAAADGMAPAGTTIRIG